LVTKQDIDRKLLDEAMELSKLSTIEKNIDEALREFILFRKQSNTLDHFGTTKFDPPTYSKE